MIIFCVLFGIKTFKLFDKVCTVCTIPLKLAWLGCERMAAALVSFLWWGWSVHRSADPMLWQCWTVWFKMLFSHVVKFASYAGVPASCISFHEQNMVGEDELTLPPDYFITYLHIGPTSSMHFLDAPFQEESEFKSSWSLPYVHRASSKTWYWKIMGRLMTFLPGVKKNTQASRSTSGATRMLRLRRASSSFLWWEPPGVTKKKATIIFIINNNYTSRVGFGNEIPQSPRKVDKKSTEYWVLGIFCWLSTPTMEKKGPFHPSSWR